MKLAFLISAHTDPQHLLRLVRSLPEESGKYLHIDAKADLQAFSLVAEQPHVHILDKRINVMWGSFLQVDFQRALMKAALSSGMDYDYLITLSGLDYPIWSNEKILHYFEGNHGKEFIQGMRLKDSGTDTKLYQEYRFLNNHAWKYGTLKSKFRVSLKNKQMMDNSKEGLLFQKKKKLYNSSFDSISEKQEELSAGLIWQNICWISTTNILLLSIILRIVSHLMKQYGKQLHSILPMQNAAS